MGICLEWYSKVLFTGITGDLGSFRIFQAYLYTLFYLLKIFLKSDAENAKEQYSTFIYKKI